jgi:hypothetical protein
LPPLCCRAAQLVWGWGATGVLFKCAPGELRCCHCVLCRHAVNGRAWRARSSTAVVGAGGLAEAAVCWRARSSRCAGAAEAGMTAAVQNWLPARAIMWRGHSLHYVPARRRAPRAAAAGQPVGSRP